MKFVIFVSLDIHISVLFEFVWYASLYIAMSNPKVALLWAVDSIVA
jgi:hypothetical protein